MLQFPNARLYIHNLLADKNLSGAEAIAKGACEYGLISIDELERTDSELHNAIVECDCCETAHFVLKTYFDHKTGDYPPGAPESSWKTLLTRLSKHNSLATSTKERTKSFACDKKCTNLAPVIFDLLLQEVHRYS